ncbi:hypothetical protein [Nesterenkonia sp.]|uniref:hypothetical protein n=1 Tax=Nesterenkonia sp. TaxID=704201 RepID=UPI00262C9369|nr:hypothetical protein [Nesterenkonia sp.]
MASAADGRTYVQNEFGEYVDYGKVKDKLLIAAAAVFEKNRVNFRPGRMAKLIGRTLRRGGIDSSVRFIWEELARERDRSGVIGSKDESRSFIRAMSLECRDNPYVSDYLRSVSGGLPGTGRK